MSRFVNLELSGQGEEFSPKKRVVKDAAYYFARANEAFADMDFDEFVSFLPRFDIYLGDLTSPDLGLDADAKKALAREAYRIRQALESGEPIPKPMPPDPVQGPMEFLRPRRVTA